jgi:PEP-CTERM motif
LKKRIVLAALTLCAQATSVHATSYLFGFSGVFDQSDPSEYLVLNGTTRLSADNAGWFAEGGDHERGNDNYAVSDDLIYFDDFSGRSYSGEFRNFLGFSLSNVVDPIVSATVVISVESGDLPTDPPSTSGLPATWTLFDLSNEPDYRVAYFSRSDVFDDLGTGFVFGQALVEPNPRTVEVNLNADAIANLNANRGGRFAFGGTLTRSVSAVPEPSHWAMLLIGFGAIGVAARHKRQRRFFFA